MTTTGSAGLSLKTAWCHGQRQTRIGGSRAAWDAIALDVTERRKLRDSLAASEERYRRLTDESAEGIIIHRGGLIRFVNPAASRMFGYEDPAELVGRPVAEHAAPDHRAAVLGRIEARLGGADVSATNVFEGLRRDGTRFWIEGTAVVMEWDGVPATRVSLIDITDRRRAEEATREVFVLRSVAELARAMAHEINNPLTVVSGRAQVLASQAPESLRPGIDSLIAACVRI